LLLTPTRITYIIEWSVLEQIEVCWDIATQTNL